MNSVVIIPPARLFETPLEVDTLLGLVEITKLSCLFFDRVYIDKDITRLLANSAVFAQYPEITGDLSTLQVDSKHHTSKKSGLCEVQVFPTKCEALHLFNATTQFPYRDRWEEGVRQAEIKFGEQAVIGMLSRLSIEMKRHTLAMSHIVGAALDAHTYTVGDGTAESIALETQVVALLASVLIPDLTTIPLSEILKQRERKSFGSVREVISKIAARARLRQPLLSPEYSVALETTRELLEELVGKTMTRKRYAIKVGIGLAGYIPILSAFTNMFDIGINTEEFIRSREHWLSFFTSFKNVKS